MGFELEKRLASELNRLSDEADREGPNRSNKHVERLKQIAAELQAKLRITPEVSEDAPGKRSNVDDLVASAVRKLDAISARTRGFETLPWQQSQRATFDDYRASGLREVLSRLSDRKLRSATLASADPAIAARSGSTTKAQPNAAGQAMWRAAERRAATLYRHAMDNGEVAGEDPVVDEALDRCGSGQPLPLAVRKQMEAELGISLARVRVHTDHVAAAAAKAVRAEAFTVGEDIFFADGFFSPDSREGKKLLAHELTHVVQGYQGRTALGGGGIKVSQPGESLEREADAVADRIDERAARPHRPETRRQRTPMPRARGSSPAITQPPIAQPIAQAPVIAKPSRGVHVQRRENAQDAEGPKKRTTDPTKRGTLPNLVIGRDRPGEKTKRDAKKGADPIRDGAKRISAEVKNVVSGAVNQLKTTAKQVQAKGVGKQAKELLKQHTKLGKDHKAEAKKAAKKAHDDAKQGANKKPQKPHIVDNDKGDPGVGAISFKPISDWGKYMPDELPDQDQRERKRILGLVKDQVNKDRHQSAKLLNQLHKAQLAQAKDVRGMLPGLKSTIQGGQNAAIGQVTAAEGAQTSAVQSHVAGVTAQVRATATQMVGQINAAFTAAKNAIRDAKQDATQKLQQAKTTALGDIDTAESTQVTLVNLQFAMTGVAIAAVGAMKAGQASARGDSYPLSYDGDKLEAARKAAREVAAEYAKAMPEEATKAFKQVDAERPKTISDIRKMATDQRKQVNDAFKQCKQTIDDAAEQANKAATDMKSAAVEQVQSTASTTSSQLSAMGAAAVSGIRQQAQGARAGIQKASAAAIAGVTDGVNKAAQGLEKGAAGLVKGAHMVETVSVEETKQRVTEGMSQLGEAGRNIASGMKKSAQGAVSGMTQQAQGAAQGMAQAATQAKGQATQMGQGANQAMSQIAQGSSQGLKQLSENFKKSAEDIAGKGKDAMKGVVDGLKDAYTAAGQQLKTGLQGAVDNVRTSFDDAVLPQEDKAIAENAKKAADAVKPWWQKALAFVVSIVVAIVVVVVVTALIVTTGPIGAILVGAAAGALGSVLGQMASNLVLGNGLMEGVTWQTVAMGAVGGAVGAGFTTAISAGASRFGATAVTTAMKGGTGIGAFAIRTGVGVAGDFVSDAATQLIFTGGYQFSMENMVTSLVTNSVTSTRRYDTLQDHFQSGLRSKVGHIEIGRMGTGPLNAEGKPSQTLRDQVDVSFHGRGDSVANQGSGEYKGAHAPLADTAGAPRTQTGGDAPRTQTGGDAPRTQTGGDAPRTQTGGDHTQTGGDRTQTSGDRTQTSGDRTQTSGDRTQTGGDRTQAGGDRTQTGGDRTQTGDRTNTGDRTQTQDAQGGDRGGHVTHQNTPDADGPHTTTAKGTADAQTGKPSGDHDGPQTQTKGAGEDKGGSSQKQGKGDHDGGHHDDGGQPQQHHDTAGDDAPAAFHASADETSGGPESALAGELSELGYPNPTRAKADQAAAAIEAGDRPPPDTIRETDANQAGLRDLETVRNDPNLSPESKTNINRDVANSLRADEPSGNLQRDVQQARATEQARIDAEAAAKKAAGSDAAAHAEAPARPDSPAGAKDGVRTSDFLDPTAEPRLRYNEGIADPKLRTMVEGQMRSLAETWPKMSVQERHQAMKAIVDSTFDALGIPRPQFGHMPLDNAHAIAHWDRWYIAVNEKHINNPDANIGDMTNYLRHEMRHIEQFYMSARFFASKGATPDQIMANMRGLPEPVARAAVADTRPLTDAQRAAGEEFARGTFSAEGRAHRAEVAANGDQAREYYRWADAEHKRVMAEHEAGRATVEELRASWERLKDATRLNRQWYEEYVRTPVENDAHATEQAYSSDGKMTPLDRIPELKAQGPFKRFRDWLKGNRGTGGTKDAANSLERAPLPDEIDGPMLPESTETTGAPKTETGAPRTEPAAKPMDLAKVQEAARTLETKLAAAADPRVDTPALRDTRRAMHELFKELGVEKATNARIEMVVRQHAPELAPRVHEFLEGIPRNSWGVEEFPKTLQDNDPLLISTDKKTTTPDGQDRAKWRESLLETMVNEHGARPVADGEKPVLYVMGGGGASGKGTLKDVLLAEGRINSEAVHIDPDAIKERIPEYGMIVNEGDSRAASVVHEESSTLAKQLLQRAYDGRMNIVYDVTLGNPTKGKALLEHARAMGYEIRLFGVSADASTAVSRNLSRARESGRYVPPEEQIKAHKGFSRGFEEYAALADHAELYDTNGKTPSLMAERHGDGPIEVRNRGQYDKFLDKGNMNIEAHTLAGLDRAAPRDIPLPDRAPTAEQYRDAAMENLGKSSRTAGGKVDTSAGADKAKSMADISGAEAAAKVKENYSGEILRLHAERERVFSDANELRTFVEETAKRINQGVVKEGELIRRHEAKAELPYTPIKDLEGAMQNFYSEFHTRLNDPNQDPVSLAAWVEYRINLTDHFFADGCGKISAAISAYVLMRKGQRLPTNTSRDTTFANAPVSKRKSVTEVDEATRQYQEWENHYRRQFQSK